MGFDSMKENTFLKNDDIQAFKIQYGLLLDLQNIKEEDINRNDNIIQAIKEAFDIPDSNKSEGNINRDGLYKQLIHHIISKILEKHNNKLENASIYNRVQIIQSPYKTNETNFYGLLNNNFNEIIQYCFLLHKPVTEKILEIVKPIQNIPEVREKQQKVVVSNISYLIPKESISFLSHGYRKDKETQVFLKFVQTLLNGKNVLVNDQTMLPEDYIYIICNITKCNEVSLDSMGFSQLITLKNKHLNHILEYDNFAYRFGSLLQSQYPNNQEKAIKILENINKSKYIIGLNYLFIDKSALDQLDQELNNNNSNNNNNNNHIKTDNQPLTTVEDENFPIFISQGTGSHSVVYDSSLACTDNNNYSNNHNNNDDNERNSIEFICNGSDMEYLVEITKTIFLKRVLNDRFPLMEYIRKLNEYLINYGVPMLDKGMSDGKLTERFISGLVTVFNTQIFTKNLVEILAITIKKNENEELKYPIIKHCLAILEVYVKEDQSYNIINTISRFILKFSEYPNSFFNDLVGIRSYLSFLDMVVTKSPTGVTEALLNITISFANIITKTDKNVFQLLSNCQGFLSTINVVSMLTNLIALKNETVTSYSIVIAKNMLESKSFDSQLKPLVKSIMKSVLTDSILIFSQFSLFFTAYLNRKIEIIQISKFKFIIVVILKNISTYYKYLEQVGTCKNLLTEMLQNDTLKEVISKYTKEPLNFLDNPNPTQIEIINKKCEELINK
ncbi:hypothetical protein DLAC_02171 [Tieghemostelium lacteum]|uniref:Uncharacterized protein n=1 Tax=Tieghemostelium lacteum TaxID=361077 RepID=A0A152A4B5_TIELA|nr:hypothetical protein DLAC_02171 [Tieghemostelium lacteum]|eukprot:KYR01076.1 hypothetical protein DLAC_02171 [Tieghemostelium lacteum]